MTGPIRRGAVFGLITFALAVGACKEKSQATGKGAAASGKETKSPTSDSTAESKATPSGTRRSLPNDFSALLDEPPVNGPGAFSKTFRSSADFFTNMPQMIDGKSPHGFVRIWYSSNVKNVINRPTFTVPPGTVAIKKYQSTSTSGYAVMVKMAAGFDPENNDWSFELRGEDGELLATPPAGKNPSCSSCHAAAQAKDFLAGTELGNPEVGADSGDTDTVATPPTTTTTDTTTATQAAAAAPGPGQFDPNFARSGGYLSLTTDMLAGHGAHGRVRIWYSNNLKDVLSGSSFAAPEGSVAVAEMDTDGQPGIDSVAVMIKKAPGYDPEHNDWYYETRDAWGTVLTDPAPGKIAQCYNCHGAAQATDYLSGTKLGNEMPVGSAGPGKFKADYASSSLFFTQMTRMTAEQTPHGAVQIWYSGNMRGLVDQNTLTAPAGSVAVARYKAADKMGLVVMVKSPGYDPEHGDWRYEVRDRYGNLLWDPRPGAIAECIACHANVKSTDFLAGSKLKN